MDDVIHPHPINGSAEEADDKVPKRILYIEDSTTSQWVLQQKLGKSVEIIIADTLAKGRDLFQQQQFDLIIIDWSLPDGKGTELLPLIRARFSSQQLPVILVSAAMDRMMMMQALQMGANDCHPKPIFWAELIKSIERMLTSPYINPQVASGAVVTWVEGFINGQFWLYCPEADIFLKGNDADTVRMDAATKLRELSTRKSTLLPACTVNVSLHWVDFATPPEGKSTTGA